MRRRIHRSERPLPLRLAWIAAAVLTLAPFLLITGSTAAQSGPNSAKAAAAASTTTVAADGSTSVQAIPHPIDLPTGSLTSAASCPNPPQLSSPLPSGGSISAPSLVPPNTGSLIVNNTTYDLAGTCEYTVTVPNPSSASATTASAPVSPDVSITWVDSGNDYQFCDAGIQCRVWFNYDGTYCYTEGLLANGYGLAFAEQELTGGYCNTDSPFTSGWTVAYNTNETAGPINFETSYDYWYASYEPGNIFFGQWAETEENPIGQQSTYVGTWNNYSPLF